MRTFERRRQDIINYVAARLVNASDSRATKMVRRVCRLYGIPATNSDIADMASEAIRRRMVDKIKQLTARVDTLETELTQVRDEAIITRNQLIALNQKVNSYHP